MPRFQINIGDHTSTQVHNGWVPFPLHLRDTMRWARTRAFWIDNNGRRCSNYFQTLPGGRSLRDLLEDNTIWVNYHANANHFGAQIGNEIMISNKSFRIGRWTVLATLIHELAHVNGAPGGHDHRAERALIECGLASSSESVGGVDDPHSPYDPNISG